MSRWGFMGFIGFTEFRASRVYEVYGFSTPYRAYRARSRSFRISLVLGGFRGFRASGLGFRA